jgi:hypothetical protein
VGRELFHPSEAAIVRTTFEEFQRFPAGGSTGRAPLSHGNALTSKDDGNEAPVVADTTCLDGLQPVAANQDHADARALAHTAIADLVNASEATTRLVNAINRAHDRQTLPFRTIGEYVAAGTGIGTGEACPESAG